MKRDIVFARLDANGVPLPHCTGACRGGRERCDCATGQTELSSDVAPDFYRQIKAPAPKPEPNWRQRAALWAVARVLAAYAFLAALVGLAGHKFTP